MIVFGRTAQVRLFRARPRGILTSSSMHNLAKLFPARSVCALNS